MVHTTRACAGVSIATGRVTIVIARGFCMTYSSMGDKRRVLSNRTQAKKNNDFKFCTIFW